MGIHGEIFWELTEASTGKVEKGHYKNVVTLDAGILLARFIKSTIVAHTSEPSFGALFLAVGTGDPAWDPLNPPPPTNTQRSLFNELARKQIASTNFVAGNGSVSAVPTNVIDLTTTFGLTEAVGTLMEMGLIGGDCSSNAAITNPILPPNGAYDPTVNVVGLDTLINYKSFKARDKPSGSSLSFTWRISL